MTITCTVTTLFCISWFFLEGYVINWWSARKSYGEPFVSFDIERIKEALKGPRYTLPRGLNREELRAYLIAHAESIEEERRP
ncbi:hypothetical protein [Pseudomonas fluorescens]|uniref:Uncharacterized protein n=2 Tax=Pseudomonas fluorescens TaxID=294 RepID=A0ABY1TE26_PSEFL|nr:hypothetical protein [Pseudomonas fluorescens]MCI4605363.1 hypothetical protein [Pseudomonas fluorescens]PQB00197.1 hypothetical protein B0A76_14205 [Pseudomonas fluorescens]RFP96743.1 hypothetical protein D0N73_07535 [Pseudomonas fluorescens]TWR48637.1 hypothetical protein FIP59_07180 [Pseudomonas fluorescens]UKJ70394.1 hypothetical protein H1Q68_07850 [Pseudomonas fluorescens]